MLDRRAHATRKQQDLSPLWTGDRYERRARAAIEQFRADALRIFSSPFIDAMALAAGGFGLEVGGFFVDRKKKRNICDRALFLI